MKYILGFDNGSTGSYTVVENGKVISFNHVPTLKISKWTKPKKKKGKLVVGHFTIIDVFKLRDDIKQILDKVDVNDIKCYLERPAVGFSGWGLWTSLSGMAAWVAVQYVLLDLNIKYETIDSKEWQSMMIPQATGINNKDYTKKLKAGERNKLLKQASDKLAKSLYPNAIIKDSGDGDSICIAHYYYLKENNLL